MRGNYIRCLHCDCTTFIEKNYSVWSNMWRNSRKHASIRFLVI